MQGLDFRVGRAFWALRTVILSNLEAPSLLGWVFFFSFFLHAWSLPNFFPDTIRRVRGCGMYTAGLNPFYASNFSLWSAYCAGGFALDTMKKPSFCIADILQAGDAENIPGSSALMVHMGHHQHHHQQHHHHRAQQQAQQQAHSGGSPLRPSPVAPEPSVYGARVSPGSPYHRHGLQLTSVSRTAFSSQQAPPPSSKDLKFGIDRILSTDFDPKGKEKSSLRGERRGFYYMMIFKKDSKKK